MLRPVPMLRLSVLVLERDEGPVLRALGALQVVELTRGFPGEASPPRSPPDLGAFITRCDRLLERVAESRRILGLARGADRPAASACTLDDLERRLGQLEHEIGEVASRREPLQEELAALEMTGDAVEGCRALGLPLDVSNRFSFFSALTGSVPLGALERLSLGGQAAVFSFPSRRGRQPVLAITTRRGRPSMERALEQVGFEPSGWPSREELALVSGQGEVERRRSRLRGDLEVIAVALSRVSEAAGGVLGEIEACVRAERRLLEARQCFPRTGSTVLIRGWVPAASLPEVRTRVGECTRQCCVMDWERPEAVQGAEVPVLLRSARFLRPFEPLVTAYGLPRYRETIPTPFVAVSFLVMFGMMFGDVGHGALLAVAGGCGWSLARTPRGRDVGLLLLFNGLASAAFGGVYGSVFGIPELRVYALWHDPLEANPVVFMGWALGVGVTLMSLGLVLNVIDRLRQGDWLGSWLGKSGIAGMVFYWSALAWLWSSATLHGRGELQGAWWVVLGIPVMAWIVREPMDWLRSRATGATGPSGAFLGAVIQGVVGAFEGVLLYLANTISFVRLAAYAMSHAALLMAAFSLAEETRRWAAGGAVLSVVVIVLGNVAAIVLEGIVAAVQALRLEYYEFFGKFFSGAGQPFRPFSLNGMSVEALAAGGKSNEG